MIQAILSILVYCDGQNLSGDCHALISTDVNPIIDDLTQDAYHSWIEQYGWLVLEDMAYCPACRKELHD